jgi:hypothetical protein
MFEVQGRVKKDSKVFDGRCLVSVSYSLDGEYSVRILVFIRVVVVNEES